MNEDARVCDLIDNDLGVWKKEFIFDSFAANEEKKIVSIPLSRLSNEDKIIRHHEKSGEFSVRSAYHASVAHKDVLKPCPLVLPTKSCSK